MQIGDDGRGTCRDQLFTTDDLHAFAKTTFTTWKNAFMRERDPEKKKKSIKHGAANRRRQRQKTVSLFLAYQYQCSPFV